MKLSREALPLTCCDTWLPGASVAAAAATVLHAEANDCCWLPSTFRPTRDDPDEDTISGTLLPRSEKSVPFPDKSVPLSCLASLSAAHAETEAAWPELSPAGLDDC